MNPTLRKYLIVAATTLAAAVCLPLTTRRTEVGHPPVRLRCVIDLKGEPVRGLIVGMNKICSDVDGAMKRARNVAAPINAQRFGLSTPCSKLGTCMDCKSPDTICCQFLITRYSRHTDRIHVILVNDNLGF